MAQLIVRNLDDTLKTALKQRALRRGTSMESEARAILENALRRRRPQGRGLGTSIRARFAKADAGGELQALPRGKLRAAKLPE